MWSPEAANVKDTEEQKSLSEWAKASEPAWRLSWRAELMKSGTAIEHLELERSATDAEASKLMVDWMDALARKDVHRALSLSAWLGEKGEIPMKALRNVSYDLTNYSKSDWHVVGIQRSGPWVAATVRQEMGGKVRNAFVPVLMTASGPRLMPEIDLFADDSRTRKFLNDESFERLAKFTGKEQIQQLKDLFGVFEKSLKKGN